MDENKLDRFELDTISDRATGVLAIKDREQTFALAQQIVSEYPAFLITNDADKKVAKELRAKYNKVIKAIDRRRIDTVNDYTTDFANSCNELKAIFETVERQFKENIESYEEAQKVVVGDVSVTKKYVATIKFTDERIVKKLTDFCTKNNCELTIK